MKYEKSLNTRMRDFYDIVILYTTRKRDIDISLLKNALERTTYKRNAENAIVNYEEILDDIEEDFHMRVLWKNFQKKFTYAADIQWNDTMKTIKGLFIETMTAIIEDYETIACL